MQRLGNAAEIHCTFITQLMQKCRRAGPVGDNQCSGRAQTEGPACRRKESMERSPDTNSASADDATCAAAHPASSIDASDADCSSWITWNRLNRRQTEKKRRTRIQLTHLDDIAGIECAYMTDELELDVVELSSNPKIMTPSMQLKKSCRVRRYIFTVASPLSPPLILIHAAAHVRLAPIAAAPVRRAPMACAHTCPHSKSGSASPRHLRLRRCNGLVVSSETKWHVVIIV
ncbi:hypothetical protein B0H14DRAFT_3472314 [Mycena olivaceomarginata]|nr:hypothetical protein B0H14DRAFT_3472314 [Mycena olivaceomarginata]